jgi:hypothetical protein
MSCVPQRRRPRVPQPTEAQEITAIHLYKRQASVENAPRGQRWALRCRGQRQPRPRNFHAMKQSPLARAIRPADLWHLLSGAPSSFGFLTAYQVSRTSARHDSDDMLSGILDTPLTTLVTSLQAVCFRESRLPGWFVRACCKRLRKGMKPNVSALVGAGLIPPAGLTLQWRSLGQTTLRQYGQPHNPLLLDDWRQTLAQASRLVRAKAGNADAFSELFTSHERAVFGFIVAHGADQTAAQEIAQDTWKKIWEQMHNYDPFYGTFAAFARHWASIMRRRYYAGIKKRRRLESALGNTFRRRLCVEDTRILS